MIKATANTARAALLALTLLFMVPTASFAVLAEEVNIEACYPGRFTQICGQAKVGMGTCVSAMRVGMCGPYGSLIGGWIPRYAIEITGQTGTSVFPLGVDVTTVLGTIQNILSKGMVSGEPASDGLMSKYREAHIYKLAQWEMLTVMAGHPNAYCLTKGEDSVGSHVFKSEVWPLWKKGADWNLFQEFDPSNQTVRAYGNVFPRSGRTNQASIVSTSLLLAYRAQSLAADFGLVQRATPWVDKFQIAGPNPGQCYPIGTPPITQEKGANRPLCADRFVIFLWQFTVKCCDYTGTQ